MVSLEKASIWYLNSDPLRCPYLTDCEYRDAIAAHARLYAVVVAFTTSTHQSQSVQSVKHAMNWIISYNSTLKGLLSWPLEEPIRYLYGVGGRNGRRIWSTWLINWMPFHNHGIKMTSCCLSPPISALSLDSDARIRKMRPVQVDPINIEALYWCTDSIFDWMT